jgi:hypothetical protein
MTYARGNADSDSVNLGSNPSSPASCRAHMTTGRLEGKERANARLKPALELNWRRNQNYKLTIMLMTFRQEVTPVQAIKVSARIRARRTCSGFMGSSRSVAALISSPLSGMCSVRTSRARVTPAARSADR